VSEQQVTGFKGLHVFSLCPKILRNSFCSEFPGPGTLKSELSDHAAFSRHNWHWRKDTAPVGFLQSACWRGPLGQHSVQLQVACEATLAPAFSQIMIRDALALNWGIFTVRASSQLPLISHSQDINSKHPNQVTPAGSSRVQ